jgi:hypothetical protein
VTTSSRVLPPKADWSLDVPIAPEAVAQRIAVSINRPKKRLLGLLKTEREYVGVVEGTDFEIWERQARAIHAVGVVRAVRGGGRIEARFLVTPRTRLLLLLFFPLYSLAAFGVASQGVHGLSFTSLAIAVAGSLVLAGIFALAARSQRDQLRSFLHGLFPEEPAP